MQGATSNPINLNTGKESKWKVVNDKAFQTIPFISDSLRGYYAAGPGEKLLSKKHTWGWKTIAYDDSTWLSPRLGTVEFAVGRGFLYGSTWYLVPRSIPFMEETKQRFGRIARSEGIDAADNFIFLYKKLVMF